MPQLWGGVAHHRWTLPADARIHDVLLYRRADRRTALRLYLFSLAYLALLFGAMVADVKL